MIGRKTVVQSHGHEWMRAKWDWYGKMFFRVTESVGVLGSHRVTAVSHALTNYYESKYGVPVAYIPPGVNPATRRPPDLIRKFGLKGNDYVLFMARLVEEKGAHYLIDAFNGIDTDLKLVIAGDAQHEERYKAVLEQKASGNPRIMFAGYVSGQLKEELLSNARCYVLPSEIEGLPIALLEVMSYGVCCIASDIPANVEALGGYGLLFRNKDVSDLRRQLTLAITGNELIQEMGRGGQARVIEQYSWEMVTDWFEALYGDLLAKR
jgi:glycosyltransferase involved in cell wall biosynthesis